MQYFESFIISLCSVRLFQNDGIKILKDCKNYHRCCNYENKLMQVVVFIFYLSIKMRVLLIFEDFIWEYYWILKSPSVICLPAELPFQLDCSILTKLSKLPFSAEDVSQNWTNDLYSVITSFSCGISVLHLSLLQALRCVPGSVVPFL